MNIVRAVEPASGTVEILTGAHFIDAYQSHVPGLRLDAMEAARVMLAKQPSWVDQLMLLRNATVKPFGLKTGDEASHLEKIGIFPVQSRTPSRVVLGFDDRHLDFRIVTDVETVKDSGKVTVTTLVRLHNVFGRVYLTSIMPFHKLIVRTILGRLTPT